jgi:hypothetical protein
MGAFGPYSRICDKEELGVRLAVVATLVRGDHFVERQSA